MKKKSLEVVLNHQISLIAMSLDEFVNLQSSIRVSKYSWYVGLRSLLQTFSPPPIHIYKTFLIALTDAVAEK